MSTVYKNKPIAHARAPPVWVKWSYTVWFSRAIPSLLPSDKQGHFFNPTTNTESSFLETFALENGGTFLAEDILEREGRRG